MAASNALLFKPLKETPLGAIKLAEIFIEAGMPPACLLLFKVLPKSVNGSPPHKDIEKVSFTGEVGIGKRVMQSAAFNLKDVTMELGGKSPLIVFEDANITEAVSAAMLGNLYIQGEICTNCTRVYVQRTVYQAFMDELKTRTENNITAVNPLDPKCKFAAF